MSMRTRLVLGAVLALAAAPALAQGAPPPPPPMPPNPVVIHRLNGGVLSGLSPAGRRVVREAMHSEALDTDRAALAAVRLRVLNLLDDDQLDIAALRRAMAEERRLADRQQQRRQEGMLDAFRRLSAEDRKAFAAGMREQHERIERVRRDMRKRAAAKINLGRE